MTAAERALSAGLDRLSDAFSTNSVFTVDGVDGSFSGIISQERFATELASGGLGVDYSLVIVASKAQFESASVELETGMRIKYKGRSWVIANLPYRDSDPVSYHIEAASPQNMR